MLNLSKSGFKAKRGVTITISVLITILVALNTVFAAPKEIKVLMMHSATGRGLPDLVGEFEKKTGIKVDLTYSASKGYDTKAELELAVGGGVYDAIWATGRAYRRWVENQWITDLEPFLDNPQLTDPETFNFDDFLGGAIRYLTVEGKLYALPILNTSQIMYYRTDIFAKYGIENAPETWKELVEIAKKIHTPEVGAIAMRGSRARGGVMWPFPQVLYSFGGRIVKDFPNDMHPVFDSPYAIQAAEYYANLLQNYGYKGTLSAHWTDVSTAMQNGKAAILIDGHPGAGLILDPEKSVVIGKIGFAMVPYGPAGRWPAFGAHGLAIPIGSKNKELAWEFIKWALSSETQLKSALVHNEVAVTRKSVFLNSQYMEKFGWEEGQFIRVVTEQSDKWLRSFYRPMTPEWGQVEDACGIAMSKVLSGEVTAEKALREANKELYEIYKEAGYYEK